MINLDALDALNREVAGCTASGKEHLFAYLFANTRSNAESLFAAARRLSGLLGIADSPPFAGYDGFDAWRSDLESRGVDPARATRVPLKDRQHNTLTEATAFVLFAIERGLTEALVVAPRFHLLRAYMTTVSVIVRMNANLRVHPAPGGDLRWDEVAVHSQGTLCAPRSELVFYEATRIVRYSEKGDLVGPEVVLSHLHHGHHGPWRSE